ncbi:MAG: hypothetical protein RL367_503, partial [Pseudomonadota bacterium]
MIPQLDVWREAWPVALAHWSKFTRLHDPRLCDSHVGAAAHGLTGSFAMIRLFDKSVVIDLARVSKLKLDDYAVEILAHEIGHHVLAPSTAADHFRLLARIRRGLPTLEAHAPMIANLYTDLLINDRLQRQAGLRMAEIYQVMRASASASDTLWMFYMGIYESLWQREKASLGGPAGDSVAEGDCWLGARLVRVYARDWMTGAGRFAALVLPYLIQAAKGGSAMAALIGDTVQAGQGSEPVGLIDLDADEIGENIHPSRDPAITGTETDTLTAQTPPTGEGGGQARQPFEYGDILRAGGVTLSDEAIAVRYYRERALPHLVRFPARIQAGVPEPQIEGLEPWDIGDPFDE